MKRPFRFDYLDENNNFVKKSYSTLEKAKNEAKKIAKLHSQEIWIQENIEYFLGSRLETIKVVSYTRFGFRVQDFDKYVEADLQRKLRAKQRGSALKVR